MVEWNSTFSIGAEAADDGALFNGDINESYDVESIFVRNAIYYGVRKYLFCRAAFHTGNGGSLRIRVLQCSLALGKTRQEHVHRVRRFLKPDWTECSVRLGTTCTAET